MRDLVHEPVVGTAEMRLLRIGDGTQPPEEAPLSSSNADQHLHTADDARRPGIRRGRASLDDADDAGRG